MPAGICAPWSLIDPRTLTPLCPLYPLDKTANAEGRRRSIGTEPHQIRRPTPSEALPPLLRQCLAEYAATGCPPAYLPKPDIGDRLMNKKLLALYGLKWNPFSPELPIEALHTPAKVGELLLARRTGTDPRRGLCPDQR